MVEDTDEAASARRITHSRN